jgi:hypothetical protein
MPLSYLDVPRIHFSGLFYTAPGNLNNDITNYNLEKDPLNFGTGMYMYPDGTAQFYLSNCVVNSVVDSDGNLWSDPGHDSLVGASVTSPGPLTQKPDGKGGHHGLAKLVDLDPNMMSRSELYGFRIYVDSAGGGFSGPLAAPPQLRDLWFGRGNGKGLDDERKQILNGLQLAVGTWHQRLKIETWTKPPDKASPVWEFLNKNSNGALDVKISVDMFQTWRKNQFTEGDRFGYGRLVGVIGRALDGEPTEFVPGRRLYAFQEQARAAKMGPAITREDAEEVIRGAGPSVAWNRADLRVCGSDNDLLIVDLYNGAPLKIEGEGKLETGSDVVLAWRGGEKLENGKVSFEYFEPDPATRKLKEAFWPAHSAIFQIKLTKDEREKIKSTPLEIRVDGRTVLRENSNGVYVNIDRPSIRLEPHSKDEVFDVFSYTFGQPSPSPKKDLTFQTNLYIEGDETTDPEEKPTTIFTATPGEPTGPGRFQLHVKTGPAVPLTEMTKVRKPLDSFLCFLEVTGKDFQVGDAGDTPPLPFISLLFWQNHKSVVDGKVIDNPVWVNEEKQKKKDPDRRGEIYPIMLMYARLFPGMVSILDISNLAMVKIYVDALIDRFSRDRTDPGFMPVSRDLSPSSVTMILTFLNRLKQEKP